MCGNTRIYFLYNPDNFGLISFDAYKGSKHEYETLLICIHDGRWNLCDLEKALIISIIKPGIAFSPR